MKSYYLFLVFIVVGLYSEAQSFAPKAPFAGNPRTRAISFNIGGYGYYGTGDYTNGPIETSDMWKYDPTANAWSSIAALPTGMQAGIGFPIGNYGYAGIGWCCSNAFASFYQYNPTLNTWTSMTSFPGTLTNDAVGFSVGSYGYVGTGAQPYSNCLTEFYQYNPALNSWTIETSFPGTARRSAMGIGSGSYGFSGGGGNNSQVNYFDNYRYNPSNNTWSPVATCPDTTYFGKPCFEINGIIYVCAKQMWAYNVSGNSWTQITNYPDSLATNSADGAFSINGNGYIIESGSKNFWEFNPLGNGGNCTTSDITTGLVASYPFTTNANDVSGHSNNGTVYGASLTTDRFGNPNSAFSFDGATNYIDLGIDTAINSILGDYSLSYWVNVITPNSVWSCVLASYSNQGGSDWRILSEVDSAGTGLIGNGFISGGNWQWSSSPPNSVVSNQWQHVVFVRSGGTTTTYTNGNIVNTSTVSTGSISNATSPPATTKIGWLFPSGTGLPGQYFKGKLDDIRIYNRALTACDADSLYNLPNQCIGATATITPQSSTTICPGSGVILNASAGNSYTWSNSQTTQGVTASQGGNYSVTVIDGSGCSASASVSVSLYAAPTVSPTATPSSICAGSNTTLAANATAGSGTISIYSWSSGIIGNSSSGSVSPNGNTSYIVTVTNSNSCSTTSSVSVTVYPLPSVTFSLPSFTNNHASILTLNGSPSGGNYTGVNGISGNTFNPSQAGLGNKSITYTYTNSNNCSNTATASTIVYDTTGVVCTSYDTITYHVFDTITSHVYDTLTTSISTTDTLIINVNLTGILPPNNTNTVTVYPNPAHDHLEINVGNLSSMSGYTFKITNALGQVVFITPVNQQSYYINLNTWTGHGVYVMYILDANQTVKSIKEIVLQ